MPPSAILYVEDEENDVLLMQFAFKRARLKNPLKIARDGQEAEDYLAGRGRFADRKEYPMPCLVLLDLNLPAVSGLEVLRWIREQPELKSLRVVIYSSSQQKQDVEQAQALGANEYLVKKSDVGEIAGTLQEKAECWMFNR